MPREDLIQLRGGTAAVWALANPVLAEREPGAETDTGVVKIGDGVTAWADLPAVGGSGTSVPDVVKVFFESNTTPDAGTGFNGTPIAFDLSYDAAGDELATINELSATLGLTYAAGTFTPIAGAENGVWAVNAWVWGAALPPDATFSALMFISVADYHSIDPGAAARAEGGQFPSVAATVAGAAFHLGVEEIIAATTPGYELPDYVCCSITRIR